ncbi:TolC family outer membrane protein [Croceibacterium aestuarii]|uniref:TolC family outer membrane protein n=1 Tax=Croceibacterium aestuarii TaxID=3064139 RepID=UPI00272E0097|nr:TolC family outer membrane protein [Croceibacterium sp. D39]
MIRKLAFLGCSALAIAAPARAETLQEALQSAYQTNPTLAAQRGQVRVADEDVPIARAAALPTLDGSATYQENVLKGDPSPSGFFSDPDRQVVAQLNADAPLFDFGAATNSIAAAKERVQASRLGLRSVESDLFVAVAAAYMGVLRDEAVVALNESNAEVMRFTLQETQERYRTGNRGPTDVAQAEARLALAQSQLESSRSDLIASRENYIKLVGHAPEDLERPPMLPQLPDTADAAVDIALDNNPEYLAALSQSRAAALDVDAVRAEGLPKLSAIGGLNQYDYLGSLQTGTGPRNGDQGTTAFIGMRLRVPFFQGGREMARVRQAQAKSSVAIERIYEAERATVADTRSAFASWQGAMRVIASAERGASANQRALMGLVAETKAGLRPLLDRLNAEQELLNSQVTLLTARRDAYVAGFDLLAAMGLAEAHHLNFDSAMLYDPAVNYDRVHARVFQFKPDPAPEARSTGTHETPKQDSAVDPSAELTIPVTPGAGR